MFLGNPTEDMANLLRGWPLTQLAFSPVVGNISAISISEIAASSQGTVVRAVSGEVYSFGHKHLARREPARQGDDQCDARAFWEDRALPHIVSFPDTEVATLPVPPELDEKNAHSDSVSDDDELEEAEPQVEGDNDE
eukprot:6878248-Prymnesium_polylepis.3